MAYYACSKGNDTSFCTLVRIARSFKDDKKDGVFDVPRARSPPPRPPLRASAPSCGDALGDRCAIFAAWSDATSGPDQVQSNPQQSNDQIDR